MATVSNGRRPPSVRLVADVGEERAGSPDVLPVGDAEFGRSHHPHFFVNAGAGHADLSWLRVSVVIPAKNEAKNIPWVLERIPPWVHEVILVDGGSTDATVEEATACIPDIRVVQQTGRGKGDALRSGFSACDGDVIVMLDADGSMDPFELPRFLALIASGFDFVKGSRYLAGGGSDDLTRVRSFGNQVFRGLANRLFGTRYSDLCYGYCGFKKSTLERLQLRADGFEIETEMNLRAHQARLRIAEVPSFEYGRISGASALNSFRDGIRILRTMMRLKWSGRESQALSSVHELSEAND